MKRTRPKIVLPLVAAKIRLRDDFQPSEPWEQDQYDAQTLEAVREILRAEGWAQPEPTEPRIYKPGTMILDLSTMDAIDLGGLPLRESE